MRRNELSFKAVMNLSESRFAGGSPRCLAESGRGGGRRQWRGKQRLAGGTEETRVRCE